MNTGYWIAIVAAFGLVMFIVGIKHGEEEL